MAGFFKFTAPLNEGPRSLRYLASLLVVAVTTVPAFFLRQTLDTATIALLFPLGVMGVAVWLGRGPAILACFVGVLALDYFIIPPYYSFAITHSESWMTLFVMLVVSLVIGTLSAKSRAGEKHRIEAQNEKNRNALLSAVSHDLRTPLTAIEGAASSLLEGDGLDPEARRQLARSIYEESERLNRLVQNLLDMTRLESGALKAKKEWNSVEEVVGSALDRLNRRLEGRPLALDLPTGLPLVSMDALLMEQLLLNLLENALNHTPPGTLLEVSAGVSGGRLTLKVADRGPGIPPGEEESIFEKFNRGRAVGDGGTGLGLAICRGIVQTHGGSIQAANRPEGGSCFTVILPVGGPPPAMQEE